MTRLSSCIAATMMMGTIANAETNAETPQHPANGHTSTINVGLHETLIVDSEPGTPVTALTEIQGGLRLSSRESSSTTWLHGAIGYGQVLGYQDDGAFQPMSENVKSRAIEVRLGVARQRCGIASCLVAGLAAGVHARETEWQQPLDAFDPERNGNTGLSFVELRLGGRLRLHDVIAIEATIGARGLYRFDSHEVPTDSDDGKLGVALLASLGVHLTP